MSTGVLITLIICATLVLLVGLILVVAAIVSRNQKRQTEKLLKDITKGFRFDDLDE